MNQLRPAGEFPSTPELHASGLPTRKPIDATGVEPGNLSMQAAVIARQGHVVSGGDTRTDDERLLAHKINAASAEDLALLAEGQVPEHMAALIAAASTNNFDALRWASTTAAARRQLPGSHVSHTASNPPKIDLNILGWARVEGGPVTEGLGGEGPHDGLNRTTNIRPFATPAVWHGAGGARARFNTPPSTSPKGVVFPADRSPRAPHTMETADDVVRPPKETRALGVARVIYRVPAQNDVRPVPRQQHFVNTPTTATPQTQRRPARHNFQGPKHRRPPLHQQIFRFAKKIATRLNRF